MKRKLILGLIIAIILATLPASTLAWGSATHAYLTEKLGNKEDVLNQQEMYGATLIDVFNFMFGVPYQPYLWTKTHYGFMTLVDAAEPEEAALAYGFVSHNEAWGADYTAHINALTLEGDKGYVITKGEELAPLLVSTIIASLEELLGAPLPDPLPPVYEELIGELSLGLAHIGIESAVDYLVSQNEDRKIGYKMLTSAQERDDSVPLLLSEAYAEGLAEATGMSLEVANGIIYETESEFQAQMISYGAALTQENALELLAEQGTELAIMILEAEHGIEVPSERYGEIFALVKNLMASTLLEAIEVVEDDYSEELEATQKYVKKQLNANKIKTYRQ